MKVFKIDADTMRHFHNFVFMRIKKKAAEPRCLLSVSSKLKPDILLSRLFRHFHGGRKNARNRCGFWRFAGKRYDLWEKRKALETLRFQGFRWCARRDLNCRGAVLRRVDRCREVLEIQGLQEIMLLNAAGLYYQILKL